MKLASIEAIVAVLDGAKVPYLVVGGLAAAAYGSGRQTQDVDIVIRLERTIVLRAFEALRSIGYQSRVPVTAEEFADPATRDLLRIQKQMTVLPMYSETHRETPLDIFAYEPFEFDVEVGRATRFELRPGLTLRVVARDTLVAMKQRSGRLQDLADIEVLQRLETPRADDA